MGHIMSYASKWIHSPLSIPLLISSSYAPINVPRVPRHGKNIAAQESKTSSLAGGICLNSGFGGCHFWHDLTMVCKTSSEDFSSEIILGPRWSHVSRPKQLRVWMVFYFKSVAGPFFPVNLYQTSLFPLHGHQRSSQRATESGVELLEPGIYREP